MARTVGDAIEGKLAAGVLDEVSTEAWDFLKPRSQGGETDEDIESRFINGAIAATSVGRAIISCDANALPLTLGAARIQRLHAAIRSAMAAYVDDLVKTAAGKQTIMVEEYVQQHDDTFKAFLNQITRGHTWGCGGKQEDPVTSIEFGMYHCRKVTG